MDTVRTTISGAVLGLLLGLTPGSAPATTCSQCVQRCCSDVPGCCGSPTCNNFCRNNCDACVHTQIQISGIDPAGVVSANGRKVLLGGHVECTDGGSLHVLRISVTQGTTGAVAEGRLQGSCGSFTLDVNARGAESFFPLAAEACALAVVSDGHGRISDAHQWCQDVELAEE